MSKKLFNVGPERGSDGWNSRTSAFDKELDKYDEFSGNQKARKNPRVAVPSPYARIQILQEAFVTVRDRQADDRDFMLVSQMLDIFEFLFENGLEQYNIQVSKIDLNGITNHLVEYSRNSIDKDGIGLLGKTLNEYAERETFGLKENKELYILHRYDTPLAITSPTSIFLPAPDLSEQTGRDAWADILLEGKRSIFAKEQSLIERSPEFVCYVYTWFESLLQRCNGIPAPLDNFSKYLENQRQGADNDLKGRIDEAKKVSIDTEYEPISLNGTEPQIWGMPFYCRKAAKLTEGIVKKSDLLLQPTKNAKGGQMPLILTNNNTSRQMVYTSTTTMWDNSNSGLDYSDPGIKLTEPSDRQLPNGLQYEGGFIYEHDFLADTIIELPYKFNDEMFFSGNPSGVRCEKTGFIPPIKEKFFDYFTLEDLKKNLSMVLKGGNDDVSLIEVYLKLPTSTGKSIVLKKTYRRADSIPVAINEVVSDSSEATGLIAPQCAVALTSLPFVRAFAEKNYYAFQLVRESYGFNDFEVNLTPIDMQNPEANEDNKFYGYVRRKEAGVATVKSYVLNGGNFDYLKLTFAEKKQSKLEALLIPLKELQPYESGKDTELEFCFDFGTSNTFVAIKNKEGKFIDFTLPTEAPYMVSTISSTQGEPASLISFEEYVRQELLPTLSRDRKPFPISTVLSVPRNADSMATVGENEEALPFLSSAIPFIFGTEDYGQEYNKIVGNLKWQFKEKDGKEYLTKAFINEVMFLAQLLGISRGAELEKCKIVWTYPLSMPKKSIKDMQTYWNQAYAKFFKGEFTPDEDTEYAEVSSFPESMAPMIYLLNNSAKEEYGTSVSVDIGGGTCDIVIIPDQEIEELKLASIGFGADCIFGLSERVANIPMFRNAIKQMQATIKKCATENNPNKAEFDKAHNYLKTLLEGEVDASEVATYLFGLPNKKELASIKDDLSFNKFLQKQPAYHHIFIYYYAALMYFITNLCDAIDDAEKPSKIFYSGSGSKMLSIFSKDKSSVLEEYSTILFNSFAEDLSKAEREDEIAIKIEKEQPKQITAKGAIINATDKESAKLQNELKNPEKAMKRNFRHYMLPFEELSYAELNQDEVKEAVAKSVIDFHGKLAKFMEENTDELFEDFVTENMKDSFLDIEERKLSKKVSSVLKKLSKESTKDDATYADVPFFAVIKRLILDVLIP